MFDNCPWLGAALYITGPAIACLVIGYIGLVVGIVGLLFLGIMGIGYLGKWLDTWPDES